MLASMNQSGGAIGKLLVVLLLVVIAASAALYAYGSRQQPLEVDALTPAPPNAGTDASTVTLDHDGQLRFATIVRNTGRLPITLEGIAAPQGKAEPLAVTSIGLGDGSNATSSAVFAPVHLDPGSGIGIVLTIAANPGYACDRLRVSATTPLPPIALRFSSYGVTGTQTLAVPDAPAVAGITRHVCAAAGA
jgi:hypothetical protein